MAATALTVAAGATFGEGVANANLQAVDAVNNNKFVNDGKTVLVVRNASGGGLVPTLKVPKNARANLAFDKALPSISNNNTALLGPFPTEIYGAEVEIAWSTGASVTAGPVSLGFTQL
jgi:hypothetical protein